MVHVTLQSVLYKISLMVLLGYFSTVLFKDLWYSTLGKRNLSCCNAFQRTLQCGEASWAGETFNWRGQLIYFIPLLHWISACCKTGHSSSSISAYESFCCKLRHKSHPSHGKAILKKCIYPKFSDKAPKRFGPRNKKWFSEPESRRRFPTRRSNIDS